MSKTVEDKTGEPGTSRRAFLKLASTAAPAAAAVAVMAPQSAEAQPADLSSTKMQDTAHTRAYLDSARF
ncbi:MAG: twin-arginine translocation signal domain-containing protein [Shimia sp.]|jgi:hypothetical protein|uniref:twin-arginine translocation signal domain-containing protein n=1 Tax=Shimia sp. TaxID=1954381 RepID=UPI0040591B76